MRELFILLFSPLSPLGPMSGGEGWVGKETNGLVGTSSSAEWIARISRVVWSRRPRERRGGYPIGQAMQGERWVGLSLHSLGLRVWSTIS